MLTRSLYLSAIWMTFSLVATLIFSRRLRRVNFTISIGWLVAVLLLGDLWAFLTFGVPIEIEYFSLFAFALGLFWILALPSWNAFGQVTWATTLLTTLLFILYAFNLTAFTPLNPISFVIAFIFFIVETTALLLAMTHTFESLDVTCRVRWKRRLTQLPLSPGYAPMVSLHLPTYNEPVEVVEQTLIYLSRLDYPNFEVLVIDNNTPDESDWRPLEEICRRLGPNFHCLHLDHWPGFKSGALNFALSQTHPQAEIIGTIDADYQIDPDFLRELVPGFADPSVAFVQTPQDYRDYEGDTYREATYNAYKYFFEVSMPARNERNAIIFCGTMGLIRRSVLEEIGGWDEWCITEDAEASLRILKRGYQSIYIHRTFGRGLMPFTFEGLKKQRFRWCFGGIQILKKHWEALMPWAHWVDPDNHLTLAQRYYYLVGGVQWFTDLFNLLFAFFLILGAVFSLVPTPLQIRPLTTTIIIVPALFLGLNLWRFQWVLRQQLNLSGGTALKTMFNFFSMGWVATLASIQGLVQKQGVFLRTPKSKSGSRAWRAIRVTQWETVIGLICLAAGLLAFVANPELRTLFLFGLLAWQASLYLAAPVFSLLSARGDRMEGPALDRGKPVVEQWAARWAFGLAAFMLVAVAVYQFLPGPFHLPAYTRFRPPEVSIRRVIGLEQVPPEKRALPATPAPSEAPTAAPSAAPTAIPSAVPATSTTAPTLAPSSVPTDTSGPTALPTAAPTALPTDTPVPSPAPTATVAATFTDTPTISP